MVSVRNMKPYPVLPLFLAAALIFTGCATQPKEQIAAARSAGVSSGLIYKLEHGGRLSPADIIELRHRHVDDAVAIRQLDRHGVDYVVDKDVISKLRKAGVGDAVIDAAINASHRFRDRGYGPYVGIYPYPYPYPYPYDPYYYGYGWPYRDHPYGGWHRW
jgi:hypothetical protein